VTNAGSACRHAFVTVQIHALCSLPPAQLTIMALREAALPEGCTRTIYMCDDGKDPLKHDWVESLPEDVIYVSGQRCASVA
jgi:hypothetical protein